MHSGEPDPIFPAPRRPRKGPGKLTRKRTLTREPRFRLRRSSRCRRVSGKGLALLNRAARRRR